MPPSSAFHIRELPRTERPRERLKSLGAHALSSAELLAILIGTGTAGRSALALAHDGYQFADCGHGGSVEGRGEVYVRTE